MASFQLLETNVLSFGFQILDINAQRIKYIPRNLRVIHPFIQLKVRCIFTYCCSVAQSCLTLCDPMDCSTPGFSVLHCLPEFAQTHVRWVNDAIQPSHPLSPPSPDIIQSSKNVMKKIRDMVPDLKKFMYKKMLCVCVFMEITGVIQVAKVILERGK